MGKSSRLLESESVDSSIKLLSFVQRITGIDGRILHTTCDHQYHGSRFKASISS